MTFEFMNKELQKQGCIFFPKIEFFINHYLEHRVFFINNNGQFFIKRGSFL